MDIRQIITRRGYETWSSWDLVYEWEDVFVEVNKDMFLYNDFKLRTNRYLKKILPFWPTMLQTRNMSFVFDMGAYSYGENLPNIIPCIIDFYLRTDSELTSFVKNHNKQKVVFVSSREVYDYLKQKNISLNIEHLPLSISDKYKITPETKFDKKYDLILMGRQNLHMENWIHKYAEQNPNLYFVYRKQEGEILNYYTNRGEFLGNINTREEYMNLMRQSRIALYSTPGLEGDKKDTHGFHQVTPRFLECIACGLHVLMCYEENSDTQYYELNKFCPNITSYEQFSTKFNEYLNTEVDMQMYSDYLSSHYTSRRVLRFMDVVKEL